MSRTFIQFHQELTVYQNAFDAAMQVNDLAGSIPADERESLRVPLVKRSRSVCIHLAQAWQQRRDLTLFSRALGEASVAVAQVQTWLEFAVMCGYVESEAGQALFGQYNQILKRLEQMITHADSWVF
ncbi:four helix bundle protein [filamentous cyanobacterium LEGE 11480]|uniref:Four helix bundle protein n=1 Tax=Romeriopsis navalis LEGE 11480 TaxID=2777977 RepID=A0A928Z6V3_9CYAN|nr:four helix bundle protein [Romeriopsis navalis]MBE9033033.1 four helix bundle protein [Romeriopsis navalis LEGE 11480]